MHSTDPAALEAQVALMPYDLGVHLDEELFETVFAAGPKATPLVSGYSECRPGLSPESEAEIGTAHVSRALYDSYFYHLCSEGCVPLNAGRGQQIKHK